MKTSWAMQIFCTLVVLSVMSPARAAPLGIGVDHDTSRQIADFAIGLRNDSGTEYDRLNVYALGPLAQSIYGLPHNRNRFSSLREMTEKWPFFVTTDGTVYHNWYATGNDFNPGEITHDGPYTSWKTPSELATRLFIPLSELDTNGDGWTGLSPDDYRIVRGPWIDQAAIAYDTAGTAHPIPDYSFTIVRVPEPASLSLLLFAPTLLLRHRARGA